MYDRLTETYWNQISGKAIVGELVGMRLIKVPIDTLMWKDWKALHPNTEVLSRDTGFPRDYSAYPYGDYESNSRVSFPVDYKDSRLHEKAVVYGIEVEGKTKAYPQDLLPDGTIEDEFSGITIKIINNRGVITFKNKVTGKEIIPVRNFWFAWFTHNPKTEVFDG